MLKYEDDSHNHDDCVRYHVYPIYMYKELKLY